MARRHGFGTEAGRARPRLHTRLVESSGDRNSRRGERLRETSATQDGVAVRTQRRSSGSAITTRCRLFVRAGSRESWEPDPGWVHDMTSRRQAADRRWELWIELTCRRRWTLDVAIAREAAGLPRWDRGRRWMIRRRREDIVDRSLRWRPQWETGWPSCTRWWQRRPRLWRSARPMRAVGSMRTARCSGTGGALISAARRLSGGAERLTHGPSFARAFVFPLFERQRVGRRGASIFRMCAARLGVLSARRAAAIAVAGLLRVDDPAHTSPPFELSRPIVPRSLQPLPALSGRLMMG